MSLVLVLNKQGKEEQVLFFSSMRVTTSRLITIRLIAADQKRMHVSARKQKKEERIHDTDSPICEEMSPDVLLPFMINLDIHNIHVEVGDTYLHTICNITK